MIFPILLLAAVHFSNACIEDDTAYLGDPRGSNGVGRATGVKSAEDCQVACQEHDGCEFWVWNSPQWRSKQNTCYFKSNDGGRKEGQEGRFSGPKFCAPEFGCFEYDVTIGRGQGNGAGVVEDVASAEDCQAECQMVDECNCWIWNTPDHERHPNKCWMKKEATEPSQEARDMNRVSGPKFC